MKRYGQETAPRIPLENIKDFPISMHCGISDHLSQVENFRWLRDRLVEQNSIVQYQEYAFGHLSFMLPKEPKLAQDIIAVIMALNPTYIPARTPIPPVIPAIVEPTTEGISDEEKAQTALGI